MANINGEWLDREARQARISLIEERIGKLEKLRKAGSLMSSQIQTLITDKKELVRLKRIHRAEHDVLYFGMEYFSEERNDNHPDNVVPAAVNDDTAAKLHEQSTDTLDKVTRGEVNRHIA